MWEDSKKGRCPRRHNNNNNNNNNDNNNNNNDNNNNSNGKKKDNYLNLAWELKKKWNMKVSVIPIVIGALGTVTKGLVKGLEDLEIRGWVETIETGQNTEKSPGHLKRLVVTQTPVKDYQLMLMWKTLTE